MSTSEISVPMVVAVSVTYLSAITRKFYDFNYK